MSENGPGGHDRSSASRRDRSGGFSVPPPEHRTVGIYIVANSAT
jgi:hypothetical protein